ncbi:MAG: MFS transporter [Novosphingobium sp.]|nr:MFS transporter [Novosphingobium sp.]
MAQVAALETTGTENHPLAIRMAVIAGLSHNMIIGCLMGSFSVMLVSVEERMGVTREMSSGVGALVIFGSALMSSFVGPLMAKHSLRLLMSLGAFLSLAGYLLLAFTNSYSLYVGSYLMLFGPSMAIAGAVGPATLVTRWFDRNRGLALGLVHLSLVVAVMPLLCNWMLEEHGARAVYLLMAGLVGVILLPATLAIRDYPPGSASGANAGQTESSLPVAEAVDDFVPSTDDPLAEAGKLAPGPESQADSMTVGQILATPAFWALTITAAMVITGIMVLTFNMIPLAESLGIDRDRGALLQSIMAFSGMAGSIIFGWVADRLGGARGIALLAFNSAVLLILLQLDLPFAALAVVIGLLGLHGAGMIPNISRALAFSLGQGSFSRAFGLQSALSVPFTAVGIWAMGAAFTRTGSYSVALIGVLVAMFVTVPFALWAAKRPFNPA